MPETYTVDAAEYLEIDGLPLSTPAWTTVDMSDLWSTSEVRGDDVLIPGAAGVLPQPRRSTVTKATIELQIVGDLKWDGTVYSDVAEGLATNVAQLRSTLFDPQTVGTDGTRSATLHLPGDLSDLSGNVTVLRLRIARVAPGYAKGQLELSLPQGALT